MAVSEHADPARARHQVQQTLFHHAASTANLNRKTLALKQAVPSIPIIDLSLPDDEAAATLGAACRGSGFFMVSHHGVNTVDAMFDQIRRLFDLPLADKMKLLQVGYIPACMPPSASLLWGCGV
jgi:hypothetical protein